MVSMTAILSVAAAITVTVDHVQAHGYIEIPEAEFTDKKTSEYIVMIDPQWEGDWEGADGDEGLVALYKELKTSNNVDNIRTLLDSDTSLYGADCGYTDPNATPKDPPTDSTSTLSRGMVHAGPCEIWLDDELVLTNDDCQSAYGDGTQDLKSVFTPVDYTKCADSGCMFRFYWLALQRLDGETVWQVYKDCVPLSGPPEGTTSTASTSTSTSTESSESEEEATEAPATEAPATETPETDAPETETETPSVTPAPSSKCTGRKRN